MNWRWLIVVLVLVPACASEPGAAAPEPPFVMPSDCSLVDGYDPCAVAALEYLAELGGGDSETISAAEALPDALVNAVELAASRFDGEIDVVMLMDATGSMRAELEMATDNMQTIVAGMRTVAGNGLRAGFAIYRDHCVDHSWYYLFDLTDDVEALWKSLGWVEVMGGGDDPESVYEAIIETARLASWRDGLRVIIVISDAPPHEIDGCSPHNAKSALQTIAAEGGSYQVFSVVLPTLP